MEENEKTRTGKSRWSNAKYSWSETKTRPKIGSGSREAFVHSTETAFYGDGDALSEQYYRESGQLCLSMQANLP